MVFYLNAKLFDLCYGTLQLTIDDMYLNTPMD